MSVGSPTAGTWSSSPWRLDNEFEMDRRGSADRAAVDGGRGPLNGRVAGHYGPIIPRFASVSGRPPRPTSGPLSAHGARSHRRGRTCHRAPKSHVDCHGWRRWPASAPDARRQTPRNVASIPNSARELGIRDAQAGTAYAAHPRGRCDGGVNDAAAARRATCLGKDEVDENNRDRDGDTARRRVTVPARADGSPNAQCLGVRPRLLSPPDPALSAHPGCPATNLRRGGAGQTARAHGPGVPDRPRRTWRRRACWVGADAGRAMRALGATSRWISMVDG